jgi:hypothetical protein
MVDGGGFDAVQPSRQVPVAHPSLSACSRADHTLITSPCVVLVTAYTAAKAPVWGAADEACPPW